MSQVLLASLNSAKINIVVVQGDDAEFPFNVMIDGVMYDSFGNAPAAISAAVHMFKAKAY
jgi:hypothetical protein